MRGAGVGERGAEGNGGAREWRLSPPKGRLCLYAGRRKRPLVLPSAAAEGGRRPGQGKRKSQKFTHGFTLGEEVTHASKVQQALSGAYPTAFIASLRTKWTAAAMVQMRRTRDLLDAPETIQKVIKDNSTRWRADVAQHGLKHCALPSCDKREVCVRQFGSCSRCRSEWYCSAEHGVLHWNEHKPICRATTAAQQAAADAGTGAA